jgi:glutathione S-transferase
MSDGLPVLRHITVSHYNEKAPWALDYKRIPPPEGRCGARPARGRARGREYLAGDRFSVADLTDASLFDPLALPPEGPSLREPPEGFERFRRPLAERPGAQRVAEIHRRHRRP